MSSPYVGEIRLFAGNFAPIDWHFCDGSLLSIAENDVLFTLIGTTYGGDGQETFGVPDLRGRVPVHQGYGSGLSTRTLGEVGGTAEVTLITPQLPSHRHPPLGSVAAATSTTPVGAVWAGSASASYSSAATSVDLAPWALGSSGGNQPHENRVPYLAVNFIIALWGIFPSQT